MNTPSEALNAGPNRGSGNAKSPSRGLSKTAESIPGIGEIKWFGGINRNTGRENDFGFIATLAGDLYFHRSDSLSPPKDLTEGATVAFNAVEGRKGKAAKSIRVMSRMDNEALMDLVNGSPPLPPDDVMTAVSFMKQLGPCEDEVFRALTALATARSSPPSVGKFWAKFVLSGPKDRFFAIAPPEVKAGYYKKHFAAFRELLGSVFSSVVSAKTTLPAVDAYRELDERDKLIAREWAGKNDYEAVIAKMLSARAAEKATKRFYEGLGATVEDVSIRQLEPGAEDWTTHDLLIDSTVAVDVKNA